MRRPAARPALVLCLLVLAACQRQEDGDAGIGGANLPSGPPVPYTVQFPKDLPSDLSTLLPKASKSKQEQDRPPSSILVVRKRAADDVATLQDALKSQGYYAGKVDQSVTRPEAGGEKPPPPAVVRFQVEPGPRFRFAHLTVLPDRPVQGWTPPTAADLGLHPGDPAAAQAVIDADQDLLKRTRKAGFALAKSGQRTTVIDPVKHTMDVTLRVDPGGKARFGKFTFAGDKGVNERFLRNRLPFKQGDPFDPDRLEQGRRALYDTNLFATVVLRQPDHLEPDGSLPLTFNLTERARHSVGVTAGYATDTGPNSTVFWEDRNIFGGGEHFRAEAQLSSIQQSADANLTIPDFLEPDQSLIGTFALGNQNTDAFDSKSVGGGLGVQRPLAPGLRVGLGLNYRLDRASSVRTPETDYGLLSLPANLDWDRTNSLLDPSTGTRTSLTFAPYLETLGKGANFFKARLSQTGYLTLSNSPRLVLAGRLGLGAILGGSRDEIPPDELFYAGGGGSVRGYAFQYAGPVDDRHQKPLGGRALFEFGTEIRYKVTDSIGLVAFLDGGTVDSTSFPTLQDGLRLGAGPGLRYYTPIGPLRVDLGFPLNPRSGVDDAFQLYVSIGQAF